MVNPNCTYLNNELLCQSNLTSEYTTYSTFKHSKINIDLKHNNHSHSDDNSSDYYPTGNNFTIFHQNIRGISNKTDELIISILPDTPHVI